MKILCSVIFQTGVCSKPAWSFGKLQAVSGLATCFAHSNCPYIVQAITNLI